VKKMSIYSNEVIDEVRNNNSILDVVSQYVTLKRSGRNYSGLCPFHKEKSPSFYVSPDKQIFHCFGCGEGGDVFGFIRKIENISFKEALEQLAERANITLPQLVNSEKDEKRQLLRTKVFEINQVTSEFYKKNLLLPRAKIAQEYVRKRKMDKYTLDTFGIGFAGNFDELYQELKKRGYTEEEMLESRLVLKSVKTGKMYDAFRNRLMFTIKDARDRIIAFGGRALDNSKPKYINSPDTIVYNKGRHLFAYNIAKKSNEKSIMLVEGYMDAISLHQRGVHNVVASLGTALTEHQARLLNGFETVIIGYDADSAGQGATTRGIEILQTLGYDIRILQIEGAKDPDEYILEYGSGQMKKTMSKAISLVEFQVKKLKETLDLKNVSDKIKFLNETSKILLKVENDIEKEVYISKIAEQYEISKESIYAQLNKMQYSVNQGSKILEKPNAIKRFENNESLENKGKENARENLIISILLNNNLEEVSKIKNVMEVKDFKNEKNKKIVQKLYEEFEKGNINNVLNLFDDEEIINHITYIMSNNWDINDTEKAIDDILKKIEKEKIINRKSEILRKITSENIEKEELMRLEEELKAISRKIAK
jgi:DNA primase